MRWAAPIAALILAGAAAGGCARLRNGLELGFAEAARIDRGQAYFRKVCAACHAVDEGPSPNSAAPPARRFANRYSQGGLARELEAIAEVGHYGMPVIPIRSDDQRDLIAYISSLNTADGH